MAFTGLVRKSAISTVSIGLLFMVVLYGFIPAAFAFDGEASNTNTGADSTNANTINDNEDIDVSKSNEATVTNSFDLNLNTGGNEVSKNTTVQGGVKTGSITLDISATTNANNNNGTTALNASGSTDTNVTASNNNTGADSQNSNNHSINSSLTIAEKNIATIANLFSVNANTGDNTVSKNTTVCCFSSGNITVAINVKNNVNNKEEGKGGVPPTDENPISQPTPSASPTPRVIAALPPVGGAAIAPLLAKGGGIVPAGADLLNFVISFLVTTLLAALLLLIDRRRGSNEV